MDDGGMDPNDMGMGDMEQEMDGGDMGDMGDMEGEEPESPSKVEAMEESPAVEEPQSAALPEEENAEGADME